MWPGGPFSRCGWRLGQGRLAAWFEFVPQDDHILGRIDSQPDAVAVNSDYGDNDVLAELDPFAFST